jgi:signal peptidase I
VHPHLVDDPAATAGTLLAEPGVIELPLEEPVVRQRPVVPYERAQPPRRFIPGVLQVGVLACLTYLCLFNFSVVRGSSMAPRIHDGDRILIDHFSYLFAGVQRGDIVVLKYPLDPTVDYIKRVIGLPGDEVVLDQGRVWVNGELIDEPYVDAPDRMARLSTHVKPAHFFVLGDNRRRSCDSREFGLVPQDYVRGKVDLRIWPPARLGMIDG